MTLALAVRRGLRLQRVGRAWLVLNGREVVGAADTLRHAILALCLILEHGAGREAGGQPIGPSTSDNRPVPVQLI